MRFEANWKGLKLDKWVLHELTTNQKNNHFEVSASLFFYITTTKPCFNWIVMCDKSGFYMTTGDD